MRILRQPFAALSQSMRQALSLRPQDKNWDSERDALLLGDHILLALQALADLSHRPIAPADLAQEIVAALQRSTGFPIVWLERDDLVAGYTTVVGQAGVVAAQDAIPVSFALAELPNTLPSAQVRATQKFVVCTDLNEGQLPLPPGLTLASAPTPIQTVICVPLIAHQRLLGTLTLAHTERFRSPETHGHWFSSLATQIAALLDYYRLGVELAHTQDRLTQTATAANALLYEWDVRTGQVLRTPTLEALSGYSLLEAQPTLAWWQQRVHPEDQAQVRALLQVHSPTQPRFELAYRWQHQDGHFLHVCDRGVIIFDAHNHPVRVVGTIDDVSPQVQADLRYRRQEQQYQHLLDSVQGVVFQTDSRGHLTFLHQSWRELTGFTVTECLGRPLWQIAHREDQSAHQESFTALIERAQAEGDYEHQYRHEARYITKQGAVRWVEIHGHLLIDPAQEQLLGLSGMVTDQTLRKQVESELLHDAHHDQLTRLPNRLLFMHRLESAAFSPGQETNTGFAILFLDLDGFKQINDTWGHSIGDQLLVAASKRLQACVRPEDTVARLGGDEFTVLLTHIPTAEAAQWVCDRILGSLSQPFELGPKTVIATSASIGIAISDTVEAHPEALLRQADTALYRAKALGKGRSVIFTEQPDETVVLPPLSTLKTEPMGTHVTPPLLVIATPTGQNHIPLIGQTRWTLGRSQNSDIVLSDRAVSRTHAEVQLHETGAYYLVDLDSGNGTSINGRRINAPHILHDGDRITLGLTHLKFQGGQSDSSSATADTSPKTVYLLQASPVQTLVWRELLTAQGIPLTVLEVGLDLPQLLTQGMRSQTEPPSLLLLDMTAIHPNPYHFCRWCRETYPQIKIILTSGTRTTIASAERKWAIHQGAAELLPGFPEPRLFTSWAQVVEQVKTVLEILNWQPIESQAMTAAFVAIRRAYPHGPHTHQGGK